MEPEEDIEKAERLDGEAYRHLLSGEYEQAESIFRQAMSLRENAFGKEHLTMARSLCYFGEVRQVQGQSAEAEDLYGRALLLVERAYPQGHPHTAHVLSKLGVLYWKSDRLIDAERLLLRAMGIKREHFGADHPQTAVSARLLAKLYHAQGRPSEALALQAQSQQAIGKMMAPVFAHAAERMAKTSQVISEASDAEVKQLESVEPSLLQSIQMTQNLVGAEHAAVADLLENYAVILRKLGRDQEADEQAACAKAIREKDGSG
jgi:tetratricopeptide (TPR) repeat protein